ncbi:family 4 glycosyl hydrolase [Halegenticoccus tardaugens]|uniref:family 4 glycosyl hydrolase n=1 Tax=Halegenticoccus tardaugens TaxID=2071624 RepID=UPI00100AC61E|nr:glycoside hydrolase family 4 [Halegenticoccus tardaugens]
MATEELATPESERRAELTTDGAVDPENLKIGYIGGGSRLWALELINDLAQTPRLGGEVVLYDIDIDSARRNERFGNWIQEHDGAVGNWTYTATDDRAAALSGADFVILSTQFPTKDTFRYDLEIPKRYGIYQAVAATIGPGGIMRAMRTIPPYRDIAAAVREHCPEAWVLNYTNPMTFVTRTLYEEFPEIKAIGFCHEVFHLQSLLASLVAEYHGIEDVRRDDIDVNVKGINHFTWVDEARWKGQDLLPLVEHHMDQPDVRRTYTPGEMDGESGFVDNNQVTYELYDQFGVLPAAGDRHLVEYATWFLNGEMPEDLLRWGVKRTTSEYRISRWDGALSRDELDRYLDDGALADDDTVARDILHALDSLKLTSPWNENPERVDQYMAGEADYEFESSGEVIVDVLQALSGVKTFETHVNLPNKGQMLDVPEDAVVETNALLGENDIKPLVSGRLPRPVHAQIMTHVHNQETIIEAAFDGYDVDRAFQGYLNDPQVKTLQVDVARDLFAELIDAERQFFSDWNLEEADVLAESDRISL